MDAPRGRAYGGRCLLLVPLAVAHQFVRDEGRQPLARSCTTAALRPRPRPVPAADRDELWEMAAHFDPPRSPASHSTRLTSLRTSSARPTGC